MSFGVIISNRNIKAYDIYKYIAEDVGTRFDTQTMN